MWIEVEFEGRTYVAREDEELTFGRGAQTSIFLGIEDATVNRIVGRFRHRDGRWSLANLGSWMELRVHDADARVDSVVKPGGSIALDWPEVTVSFTSGEYPPTAFEFLVMQSLPADPVRTERPSLAGDATRIPAAFRNDLTVELSPMQRRLVVALCERRLRDPLDSTIPPSKDVANRLGWKVKKFNKKLDEVCRRFHAAGFTNVYDPGGMATSRRNALVDAATLRAVVTPADLALLDLPIITEADDDWS